MKLLEYDRIKRHEIDQQVQKYNAERNARNSDYEAQIDNYRHTIEDIANKVKLNLEQTLPYSDLLDINVSQGFGGGQSLRVRISYDLNRTRNQSLAWDYSVGLDRDGNIKKESGSWSGLNAVTQEQLDDLEKSIEILKKLNSINWEPIVKTDIPNQKDYVTTRPIPKKDFTFEQFNADLEDFVGQDVIFIPKYLLNNLQDYDASGVIIKRLTNKRVECVFIYNIAARLKNKDFADYVEKQSQKRYVKVMSKEKLLGILENDYAIIDFNGNEIGD